MEEFRIPSRWEQSKGKTHMSDNLIKRSVLVRMVLIGGLTVALLIPSVFIMGLVDEREGTRDRAVREVSDKWGNAQTIAGPILTVPYRVPSYTTKEATVYSTEPAHFLPESLIVSATLQPEIRYRGMYEAVLYSSRVLLEGSFAAPAFQRLGIAPEDILRNKASLSLGISDLRGVKEGVRVQFGNQSLMADPGVNSTDALSMGIGVRPTLNPSTKEYRFSTTLDFNGTSFPA